MSMWLKQSTAATKKFGPFLDDTDGKTAETGLTIAQADIRISKNGGAFAQSNNAAGATHDEKGFYGVPFDATDTATLGDIEVNIHVAGALPVIRRYMVVPANSFNSIILGSDYLQTDAMQVEGADATDTIRDSLVDDATRIDASAINTLSAASIPSAAAVADAVWDEATSGHTTSGTFGEQTKTDIDSVLSNLATVTAKLPSKTYLAGSNNSDGDVELDEATGAASTTIGTVNALGATAKGHVNAEVVDALGVDTLTELTQAAPSATPTIKQALMLLYMALRNKGTQTTSEKAVYNDAGTKIAKKAVTDDGTTYTEAQMTTGA